MRILAAGLTARLSIPVSAKTATPGRRRECISCGKRFTTYEKVESTPVLVIKNNGNRQIFDPSKIKNGLLKACEKRPVPASVIDKIVNDIEKTVNNSLVQEITSKKSAKWLWRR